MPESPRTPSPYEVLGVAASASHAELRKAFRKAMRDTHPDTGGDPSRFTAVQVAWERVGHPNSRAAYDAGRGARGEHETFAAQPARPRKDSRPKSRSYGHPGGWRREKFLAQMREWVGRGVTLDDPYDPALVRSAPPEIRHTLANALAEESTAGTLGMLGIGFTVWHDVSTGDPEHKLDHILLAPTGLIALMSEDFGGPVRVRRGELIGDAVAGQRPMHDLTARAKIVTRLFRVKFAGLVIVIPDDALDDAVVTLGTVRGAHAVAVRQSALANLMRTGLPGSVPIGGNELFDVRTRLQGGVRFV